MSGVPNVKLEQYLGGSWVDLTSRLMAFEDYGTPMQITRGVGTSGECVPGSFTLTLNNDDGNLTPRKASGTYYPDLVRYRPIRLTAYIGGAWRGRFAGYVDTETLRWGGSAEECSVDLTCTDALGLAGKLLRSVATEAAVARGPLGYWPLTDAEATEAADQSGNALPGLAVQQYQTEGEIAWASGVILPTDNAGGIVFTPTTNGGKYLRSTSGFDLPASWSASVFPTPAAKDGYVFQVGTDSYSIGVWYSTSTGKFSAIETLLDSSGDPIDYVMSTSTSAWTGGMETLTVTATTIKLGSSGTTGTRHASETMLGSLVSVGGALAVESGRARMYSGEVKHLALWSGSVPSGVDTDTLTGPADLFTMSTAVETLLAWSGVTATVVALGTDWPVELVKTEGTTALELLTGYALGSLARIFVDCDGQVAIAAFDYSPTAVVAPSAEIDPTVEWAADPEGDVRSVTMTWPDGTTYTATGSTGSGTAEIPGALASAAGRSVADWMVATADGRQRFPAAPYDLMTLASPDGLALLEVGTALQVPGLPSQLPSTTETGVTDLIVETLGVAEWSRTFTTSPDTRERLFVAGDSTQGVVGGGYLSGPLGPETGAQGSLWGIEEVTAAKLNASAYAGSAMQVGQATVTPSAPNTPTSLAVTFATAFASTPKVTVTPVTDKVYSEVRGWAATSITTTGFLIWVNRTNTTATDLSWAAVI